MSTMIWLGLIVVMTIIQSTLLPLVAIKGIYPDILLIMVVSYALLSGKEKGVGMGFFVGLLQDLAFGSVFGSYTLSKLATGYFFGLAERKVFKEHIILPVAAVAVGTVLNGLVLAVVLLLIGHKTDIFAVFINSILPQALYNLLIAIPIHHFVYRLTKYKSE